MTTYYKATRPDGTDFHTGKIDYGAALLTGEPITHPSFDRKAGAESYLSVSTSPTDCTSFSWPCRLFRVEPIGRAYKVSSDLPNKRAVCALVVAEELPAREVFGPNGEAVVAVIDRARLLTRDEVKRLAAALDAAWWAARAAAWDAALDAAWWAARAAAWDAAWDASDASDAACAAARDAARDAALAELTRDLITTEQYDLLIGPWRSVVGAS